MWEVFSTLSICIEFSHGLGRTETIRLHLAITALERPGTIGDTVNPGPMQLDLSFFKTFLRRHQIQCSGNELFLNDHFWLGVQLRR